MAERQYATVNAEAHVKSWQVPV